MSMMPTPDPQNNEEATFASLVEMDISNGVKRTEKDLERYITYKLSSFDRTPYWRHKETQIIYEFRGLGLASTGNGKLVLMIRFAPHLSGGRMEFERQDYGFYESFEPVMPSTIWVKN